MSRNVENFISDNAFYEFLRPDKEEEKAGVLPVKIKIGPNKEHNLTGTLKKVELVVE